jgi:hypothetical protein
MLFVALDFPREQQRLASLILIDACELDVAYDVHHNDVCVIELWVLLAATGALSVHPDPFVNAFLAKELILAVIALLRVPVLSDDHVADHASDHVLQFPHLLRFYHS